MLAWVRYPFTAFNAMRGRSRASETPRRKFTSLYGFLVRFMNSEIDPPGGNQ